MVSVIFKMLPFALGTIAPTMIGLVVLFLTGAQGLLKSFSFIIGKYIVYVLWGLVCLNLAGFISSSSSARSSAVTEIFFLIFGFLLLILAVRSFFGEDDSDDTDSPPPKFMTILDQLGPFKLFGLGIAISIMQPRFILFVLAGASIIAEAQLPVSENFISILVLALLMVWAMLIPVIVFLVMGERRNSAVKSMRTWLVSNQRLINVVVMGFFGILMIGLGLSHIY